MTSLLSWIATSTKRKASTRLALAFDVHSAAGRPAKKTSGSAPADTNGTRSTLEALAQPVSTSGLRPSASRVKDGRCTPIGMKSETGRRAQMIAIRRRRFLSRRVVTIFPVLGAHPMQVRYHDSHGSQHYPVVSRLFQ
jgi:hypothetical protein